MKTTIMMNDVTRTMTASLRAGFEKAALVLSALPSSKKAFRHLLLAGVATFSLAGCNTFSRLAEMGQQPDLKEIDNPTHAHDYKPVSMPMPEPITTKRLANSLWRPGSRAFLKDLRANQVGDIVTVVISIDEDASFENTTTRSRTTAENVDVDSILGYEGALNSVLPEAVNPADILAYDGSTTNTGAGSIERDETVNLQVAAIVTQVLPNGNLVIHGKQETRVNFEVRELLVAGVIRPQDISSSNTITYEKIAEARLAYGGRGQITDFQQPRWGTQIVDILMPF